jgi:protein-disulfide isomerase
MHFPLPSHQNAQLAAETAECLWSQKSYLFFNFINEVFKEQKFDKDSLISKAVQLWADKENLTQCVDTWFFREKVQNQKALAEALLWINSTPSVVIRNNFNWNFTILTWVHTLEEYQKALEGLYK